ncbi:MAG: Flp family type IVb pilin [Actinomycetia bacterium]|nr:Flp family type IVb pilin [Actinomycetes bacterium]
MVQIDFIKAWLEAQVRTERGASLVEYALLVALIAVACIAAMSFLKGGIETNFSSAGSELT